MNGEPDEIDVIAGDPAATLGQAALSAEHEMCQSTAAGRVEQYGARRQQRSCTEPTSMKSSVSRREGMVFLERRRP